MIRTSPRLQRSALVVDVRDAEFLRRFPALHRGLRRRGLRVSLLFLEAEDKILQRRFSETRRPHPMGANQPVPEGIREEREALRTIRKAADHILDTSDLTVHQLRAWVRENFGGKPGAEKLVVSVTSFGYKYGVPSEADLVFDVRFLPNPNFVPRLKPLTGNHPSIVRYLRRQPETAPFLRRLAQFVSWLLPRYAREGKSHLTIAVGCTGGRHRSVMIANALAEAIEGPKLSVHARHRDARL
jgi:UPF0042 nucleotide-binding protein